MEKSIQEELKNVPSDKDVNCPVANTMKILSNKWKARIICFLSNLGTLRFSELRDGMSDVTESTLVNNLKELVNMGIVTKTVYDEMPPRTEYDLTERGRELVPILRQMRAWSHGVRLENEAELPRCKGCDFLCK